MKGLKEGGRGDSENAISDNLETRRRESRAL
jgi:hypothetical protein